MKNNENKRSNNVERIQHNISNTIENIRLANEMIEITSDAKTRESLTDKNERREEALEKMRKEIREEAMAREEGYK